MTLLLWAHAEEVQQFSRNAVSHIHTCRSSAQIASILSSVLLHRVRTRDFCLFSATEEPTKSPRWGPDMCCVVFCSIRSSFKTVLHLFFHCIYTLFIIIRYNKQEMEKNQRICQQFFTMKINEAFKFFVQYFKHCFTRLAFTTKRTVSAPRFEPRPLFVFLPFYHNCYYNYY